MCVTKQVHSGGAHVMGYLGMRQSIGGRALLSGMPHMASVVVHSDGATVLCLASDSFYAVREMLKRKQVVRLLSQVAILKGLKPHQLEDLSRACRVQAFQQVYTRALGSVLVFCCASPICA
jgi:CRP-like cAMP-binding protein